MKKLLTLWLCLLLMATLCPGAQYAYSKRGGLFKGRGKGDGDKAPPSKSRGLSKQGLKWAGAAAAGALGGTGYGLGLLGKPKRGSPHHHGKKAASSEKDPPLYYHEGQRFHNQPQRKAFSAAASANTSNNFYILGSLMSFIMTAWIRGV